MLDLKYVLANVELVKQNCRDRHVSPEILEEVGNVVRLDGEYRLILKEVEDLRRRANEVAQATGKEKDAEKRSQLVAEGKSLKTASGDKEATLRALEIELKDRLGRIPNMTHPDAPVGSGDDANRELRIVGTPRKFEWTPRDHLEIGRDLDMIDFEAGGKVTGSGFYYLKNDAVLLDLALQQYAMRKLAGAGFTPVITPDLARIQILEGIGFNPRGSETQVYSVDQTDLCLVGTAEITLGGMLADTVLEETEMPKRYVGLSHCFRTEAGAAGRASRGLYRVHQFTKVEMFAFCKPEDSGPIHLEFLKLEEEIFQELGIPYRVIDTCTGDLGGPAYRKFDLEAWMPAFFAGGGFGEVTSTSDCSDYQARRLNIRYKPEGQKGTKFVHTLNGTAVAISRAIIAILENYQREDGFVDVPAVLVPYLGKTILGKKV